MKPLFTLSALILLTFSACKKKIVNPISPDVTYDIPYEQIIKISDVYKKVNLPYNPGAFPPGLGFKIVLPTTGYATNYETYLNQYNASADQIKKTQITEVSFEVISPATENLNYFDSVKMFIHSKTLPADSLVAYKDTIADGSKKTFLNLTNLEYKPYFVTDSAFLKMQLFLTGMPDSTTVYKLKTVMRLTLSGK